MSLIRRINRLEARLRPPPEDDPDKGSAEFDRKLWLVYGRPGDPPQPANPVPLKEFELVVNTVNDYFQWAMGERSEQSERDGPPVVRRPAYLVHWLETGRVTHPLLRYAIIALTGGRYTPDTNPDPRFHPNLFPAPDDEPGSAPDPVHPGPDPVTNPGPGPPPSHPPILPPFQNPKIPAISCTFLHLPPCASPPETPVNPATTPINRLHPSSLLLSPDHPPAPSTPFCPPNLQLPAHRLLSS